ncbi:M3 family metallopeptidase [Psychrobacter sp. I-STPA6b]|uniref:M3 family metallopeptidase n=1 Tax=Psychrobacter sp. I-STPA6b TaxID=2585718 RepID=UPI001D0C85B4|nr:M3 family metallopeptidase [Psychrobacter sp. I-STPA6b]
MSLNTTQNTLSTALQLVDFEQVSPDSLQLEVREAIAQANQFLDNLSDTPTDAQTALAEVCAFDHLNLALDRSWGIVSHLNSVMSKEDIRQVHHELLPELSAYGTRVGQHKALFQRYQTIKEDSAFFATLETARQRAIELALQGFELSGVALEEDKQQQYAEIQSQLSTLSATFSDNILDATQAFALPLEDNQLAGITDSGLALLAQAGEQYKTKLVESQQKSQSEVDALPTPYYVATLDIPVYLAVMTYADDRTLRETLYKAYVTRASEYDSHTNSKGESLNNADIMQQILALREQKAQLLGFTNYAQLSLSTKMAESSEQVASFLRNLADKARPSAKQDLTQLQDEAKKYDIDEIQPWDSAFLAEKVKQDKFQLSQEQIRPYFPLPKVIDGLFTIVNKLYGIRAIEHSADVTRWHDDVRFYQLFDADDSLIGGFYFDLYARQGKRGGAWMSGFQSRYQYPKDSQTADHDIRLPVCFMVGNFTPPTDANSPSLLTHNEVLTLFHEFGHGLHHLLTQVNISDVAGVNGVEWDAVELPSQFMENWAWDSEGIALISAHVDTGEPLPQDKLNALLSAKNFQSGMQTLRQIEFALFDLLIHADSPAPNYQGILQTLDDVRAEVAILPTPDYNRFANGFSHIFAGGYAAGYYSYKWAELLSSDAFSKFEEEGIFNSQTGKAFRDHILSVGGSQPAKVNFEAFRGRAANIDALLRHSGFTTSDVDSKPTANSEAS